MCLAASYWLSHICMLYGNWVAWEGAVTCGLHKTTKFVFEYSQWLYCMPFELCQYNKVWWGKTKVCQISLIIIILMYSA